MANEDRQKHALGSEICAARERVQQVQVAHSCGRATADDVNAANDRLAKAHEALQHHTGGVILTGRDLAELEK